MSTIDVIDNKNGKKFKTIKMIMTFKKSCCIVIQVYTLHSVMFFSTKSCMELF